ncbi:MAG TPA: PhoH family protein [Kiritimatiellia bacterium]|nr:PhoH family protein [Kiritimatiellia bacterium]HMO97739.1 PhoH family protein [Kiritimatiellia bacterium]HMP95378.1 PhoH family protein [Kiritimatiellia bacterium]
MRKRYILDTNVLLHDPNALYQFQDNEVVVPLKVIEEIDRFKRDQTELGRNARQVSRMLDEIRGRGNLSQGVALPGGGDLRIAFPGDRHRYAEGATADDQILHLSMLMKETDDKVPPIIVVSKDINLRLKADALGLEAEDYETGQVNIDELFLGHSAHDVDGEVLERFRQEGYVEPEGFTPSPNEYVLLRNAAETSHTLLTRYDAGSGRLVPLIPAPDEIRPVHPRNKEQHYAMDALLNDDIKLLTIIGKAGTGKTLLAVAAAMFKTLDQKNYRRMLICRPTIPMGKDIGFLPGTVEEKLNPWMQPIFDAMDLIANGRKGGGKGSAKIMSEDSDRVAIEPLTYIRGRSIPNQYIVVDEAQNLTPLEAKTVLTRVGPGTKIVLTGDIYQIDNPYVDSMSNGLSSIVEKFRSQPIAAHIVLNKGVRSEVADLAANLL